jgi:hypothetical protein
MLCPHCNCQVNASNIPAMELAEMNAENYGSSVFIFQCPHCQNKFGIYIERKIKVGKAYKVHKDNDTSY